MTFDTKFLHLQRIYADALDLEAGNFEFPARRVYGGRIKEITAEMNVIFRALHHAIRDARLESNRKCLPSEDDLQLQFSLR